MFIQSILFSIPFWAVHFKRIVSVKQKKPNKTKPSEMSRDVENVFSEKWLKEKITSSVERRKMVSNILEVIIKPAVACCCM